MIIGDLPYFITKTERDDLFVEGFLAGAPPDRYTQKGQYWGLPIFDWEHKYEENLAYLLKRLHRAFSLFDVVRLDHFCGLAAVWAIPAKYKSGKKGDWLKVPGERILTKIRQKFPDKILIAEDLGIITPEVTELRKKFGLLGTKVMVFGARKVKKDEVLYSSTHDTMGMGKIREFRDVRELGERSGAKIFIIPMWDILGLGKGFRFNRPGRKGGNWQWRIDKIEK
ncbi:MAG: 4-alpha-glucanotransferase [Patescibacteria group bacterium]